MTGQTLNYEKSVLHTPHQEMSEELHRIRIDYDGLIAYAREKNVNISELSDEEKNRFILNSDMKQIKQLRNA